MSDVPVKSTTASVARAFAVVEALAGHSIEGRRLRDVASDTAQSAPTTLRDLQGLQALGLAERLPGRADCWRLTTRLVRIATAHAAEMSRARQRLDDIDHNYTRTA